MSVQTSYTLNHNQAYAGMMTSLEVTNTISKLNKGTEVIPHGLAVVTDGDDGAKLPETGATAAQFNGVVMYEINRAQKDGDVAGAVPNQDFTVVTMGEVWVEPVVDVTKDSPVYFVTATGVNAGKFSNVAGTGLTAGVLIPNAKWTTSASAGSLAKISLSIGG